MKALVYKIVFQKIVLYLSLLTLFILTGATSNPSNAVGNLDTKYLSRKLPMQQELLQTPSYCEKESLQDQTGFIPDIFNSLQKNEECENNKSLLGGDNSNRTKYNNIGS